MALSLKIQYTRVRTNASTPHGRFLLLKAVTANRRLQHHFVYGDEADNLDPSRCSLGHVRGPSTVGYVFDF